MSNFAHLHVHTEHSTLDGINRVDTLPTYVKEELGQTALAQTEHGVVTGSLKFVKSCRKAGVKPICGMESYYSVVDRSVRERDADGERYYHLVLLAANGIGLKNLVKLSSRAYTEGLFYKPRLDDALLADHNEGIVATTSCLGSRFSKLILLNRTPEAGPSHGSMRAAWYS